MNGTAPFKLEPGKQDDLRHWWRLSRPSGRVLDHGAEAYIASYLAAAGRTVDPGSRIRVSVDGVPGGCYVAVRMQVDSIDVAAEIAQAVLGSARRGFFSGGLRRLNRDLLHEVFFSLPAPLSQRHLLEHLDRTGRHWQALEPPKRPHFPSPSLRVVRTAGLLGAKTCSSLDQVRGGL